MFQIVKKTFLLLIIACQLFGQNNQTLTRSTPEAEGVNTENIINFIDAINASKHEMHSYMILRHGKVVSEGWWSPYRADLKHTLYSCSKSFVATAVGFAVAEKLITVDDKVVSFFPNDLPETISPFLAELKIKDLLSMTVGHEKENSTLIATNDNWIKAFLATPIKYQPGTKFLYNSPATFMLSAIVQQVTKQKVIDYLKPRLWAPLGISGIDWEVNPQGINTGGWGLRLKTEDMAKFGQLFLQKGKWKGKQILPESWVDEASTMKIMQDPTATQAKKDSSDWLQGYCYQMWRCRNNGYRADGANGQYIIVLPEKDAVIAITSETNSMQGEINLVWKHLLPAFTDNKLPKNAKLNADLNAKNKSLALPIAAKSNLNNREATISGKSFAVFSNDNSMKNIGFDFKNNTLNLTLKTDSVSHNIAFGNGQWAYGETTKFGPYLVARARANRVGLPAFKVAGSYNWVDDKNLDLTLRYIESGHFETFKCTFDGDKVLIDVVNIFNKNQKNRPIIKAVLVNEVNTKIKLVIRGDDMGFSHSANEALIKSYKEGIETSIEIIAPSPWFPEAVKLLAENPKVDVGLHFAITAEWDNVKWRPLTDAPSLRNKDGYFYQMLFPNKNYPMQAVQDNAWKMADVEKELRAQIELGLKYVPRLSHISGHMGSTGFSTEIKEMAIKVAKEYNLIMVDVDGLKDYNTTYTGFDIKNKNTEERIQAFIEMINKLETGKNYVFVEHPGIDNAELQAIYHIGYEDVAKHRQDVTNIFTSEKVKEAIVRKGLSLVSYKELIAAGK
jgi:CubicO group peptidase (beta-lactamase class C family)/predicted glycoside hydrolase/deacetylase ChbG (UPF0249 family)